LYQTGLPHSRLLLSILKRLAAKYASTSFVKIQADLCIPFYPDKNVPTLLIYHEGELVTQIVGLTKFGGHLASAENVEIVLKGIGCCHTQSVGYVGDEQERGSLDEKRLSLDDDSDWD
jgi:Phosducin